MHRPRPFGRAQAMAAAVLAAMAWPDIAARMVALGEIGPYRSRGKGRGTPSRVYGNKPGKYMPHQGLRERLRRKYGGMHNVRQIELELEAEERGG